jgi:hypothetical protein
MTTRSEIAQRAREQLAQFTGLEPGTVSGFGRHKGDWRVTVDLIELRRIPEAIDVMACYEVLVDDEGNLLSYQRTKRYLRQAVTEPEAQPGQVRTDGTERSKRR